MNILEFAGAEQYFFTGLVCVEWYDAHHDAQHDLVTVDSEVVISVGRTKAALAAGWHPLRYQGFAKAAALGSLEVIKRFRQEHFPWVDDFAVPGKDPQKTLTAAVEAKHDDVVLFLIKNGCPRDGFTFDERDHILLEVLERAGGKRDIETLLECVEVWWNLYPERAPTVPDVLLYFLASYGLLFLIKWLRFECGSRPVGRGLCRDCTIWNGWNRVPLDAAACGHKHVVLWSLDNATNTDIGDFDLSTEDVQNIMYVAHKGGQHEVLNALEARGYYWREEESLFCTGAEDVFGRCRPLSCKMCSCTSFMQDTPTGMVLTGAVCRYCGGRPRTWLL